MPVLNGPTELTAPPALRYFYGLCSPQLPQFMAKAASPTATANSPASFESALSELETIVKSLELGSGAAGGLPLEESLAAYQRGMTLLRYCQEALTAAEQKVQVLEKDALRDFTPASEE